MNKEFIKKWIAALRSGEYKQTISCLHDANGFCCYGVACDLEDPNAWRECDNVMLNNSPYRWNNGPKDWAILMPPSRIMSKLGFDVDYQSMQNGQNFATMNDKGSSFEEIALALEKHYGRYIEEGNTEANQG